MWKGMQIQKYVLVQADKDGGDKTLKSMTGPAK